MVIEGKLSSGHARAIISIEDKEKQLEVAMRIVEEGLSVRTVENIAKKIIENKVKYKYLYEVFDKYHEMPLETVDWHDGMIKEATREYK